MNPYTYPILYLLALAVFIGTNLVLVGRVKSQVRRLTAEKTPIHRLKALEEELEAQDVRIRSQKRMIVANEALIEDQAGQLQKHRARVAADLRKKAEIDLDKIAEYIRPVTPPENSEPEDVGADLPSNIDPAYL